MRLQWNSAQISARVRAASIGAIGETTQDAADHARTTHSFRSETGRLEASIEALDPEATPEGASGQWGASEPYAIDVEREQPFLRPAGDATYPLLPARIRARFEA